MEVLHKIEDQLAPVFKDLPELPKGAKDALVNWLSYIALIFGIIEIIAAIGLFGVITTANSALNYVNQLSIYATGHSAYTGVDLITIYAGIGLLAVNAIILLMAYGPLSKKMKKGWDLFFLSNIINVLYGVLEIFMVGRGIGSFLASLVGSAIGLYLLFQIRDRYTSKKTKKA